MKRTFIACVPLLSLALVAGLCVGCNQQTAESPQSWPTEPSAQGRQFILSEEPAEAEDVAQAFENTEDEQEVAVVGRIGGSRNPWVKGSAVFTIVDPALKACSDIEGDMCKTPWDYCCEPSESMKKSKALVKFVDEKGSVIPTDARELLAVKELQTVVVRGKAQRDEAGNLKILASGIYVHR